MSGGLPHKIKKSRLAAGPFYYFISNFHYFLAYITSFTSFTVRATSGR